VAERCKHFQLIAPGNAWKWLHINALSQGGQVHMPLQQTFWSAKFGMLQDKFGISWMVNCAQAA
jgi:uncharacterized glyoxalase superfamily protein PhnB